MTKLEAALAWAARGFPVFPLRENEKEPLGGSNGHLSATTDVEQIERWWTDPLTGMSLNYNIGTSPRNGDWLIVDLDVKDDRDGPGNFLTLGGDIGGLVVRTAGGGYHVYLRAPDTDNTIGMLGLGIDTRGSGGYAVAPGSTIDGVDYEIIQDDPPLDAPPAILDRLPGKSERARAVVCYSIEDDQPANVRRAEQVARAYEPAVSGMWHALGYRLGCEMARIGLSPEKTVGVLYEHWVPRGTGFKSYDQFVRDCLGGYHDSVSAGEHGHNSVDAALSSFDGIEIKVFEDESEERVHSLDNPKEQKVLDILPTRTWQEGYALRNNEVPYLVKDLIGPGQLFAVIGGPGSGKSVLLPEFAFCVALGRPFLGKKTKQARVLYFAAEDGLGLERRLQVLGDRYGDPGDALRVCVTTFDLSPEGATLKTFIRTVDYWQPGLVIVDTMFAGYPKVDLTDRSDIGVGWVVATSKELAARNSRPVVAYGHHNPKSGGLVAYGGQQLDGAWDSTLAVEGCMAEPRLVTVRKNRMGRDGETYKFEIGSAPVCVDWEGDTVTAPIINWITPEGESVHTRAQQDAWLADTDSGARAVMDSLREMTEAALAAGSGSSLAEMMGGGPRARLRREAVMAQLITYGLIEADTLPANAVKTTDHWLKELKKRDFVDYDSTDVWVRPR